VGGTSGEITGRVLGACPTCFVDVVHGKSRDSPQLRGQTSLPPAGSFGRVVLGGIHGLGRIAGLVGWIKSTVVPQAWEGWYRRRRRVGRVTASELGGGINFGTRGREMKPCG